MTKYETEFSRQDFIGAVFESMDSWWREVQAQRVAAGDTQYGSAANGSNYQGRTVGGGWDVTVKRESRNFALVNVMTPNGEGDWLGVLDVEADQNMQELAIRLAHHPDFSSGWLFDDDSDEWNDLAERWNAIEVE